VGYCRSIFSMALQNFGFKPSGSRTSWAGPKYGLAIWHIGNQAQPRKFLLHIFVLREAASN
jgi:hypothetical protein